MFSKRVQFDLFKYSLFLLKHPFSHHWRERWPLAIPRNSPACNWACQILLSKFRKRNVIISHQCELATARIPDGRQRDCYLKDIESEARKWWWNAELLKSYYKVFSLLLNFIPYILDWRLLIPEPAKSSLGTLWQSTRSTREHWTGT